jgi:hypothetical protein
MDILKILEDSAAEIRSLRAEAEGNKMMMINLSIRLAINQLRKGNLSYLNESKEVWNKLLELATNGRLSLASNGEVFLDLRDLTKELLDKELSSSKDETCQIVSGGDGANL